MRYLLSILVIGVLMGSAVGQTCVPSTTQTCTPNVGLALPNQNTPAWGVPLNQNFTLLDQLLSGTAGVPSLTVGSLDNIIYVDGVKYPCTAAGVIAMLSAATAQANAQGCVTGFTVASELDAPADIPFLHPSTSTWTFSGTNSSQYGVKLATGALFGGSSGAASDTNAFALQASPSANLDSLLGTDATLVGGGYFAAENFKLYNPAGGIFANGLLHAEHMVDGSFFRNVAVANYSGIGVNWRNNCCASYTLGMVSNGNYSSGAIPMQMPADASHLNVASNFFATSLGHPGAGKNNLTMAGTSRFWCHGNSFFGLYEEAATGIGDTTTPANDLTCAGGTNFFGLTLGTDDPSSTRYVVQIETNNEGINAFGVESAVSLNIINDLTNGVTVPAAHVWQPINYISMASYFTNLNLLKTIPKYNNIPTVANGIPAEYGTVDLTAQSANISTTTLYTTPSAGLYRVSCYTVVTTPATSSSTLPSCQIFWIDKDNSTSQGLTVVGTSTGNALTTFGQGTAVLSVKAATAIQYSTTSYATSGATSMQYAVHIRLEAL